MHSPGGRLTIIASLVLLVAATSSVCSKKAAPDGKPAAAATGAAPLIADMTPVVSVKELMAHMIDPIADNVFDAVWWDSTSRGVVAHKPTTDDDWEKVRVGAVTIIEGIELLKVPRPLAPAGDVNNSTGPNAPELSPTEIKAKIDRDPVLWIAKIQALRNVGLEVLEIANKKDVAALWQAGGDLDDACEACHLEYWYPGDKATVLAEKNNRARIEKPPATAPPKAHE
jgi:hypothetical protein